VFEDMNWCRGVTPWGLRVYCRDWDIAIEFWKASAAYHGDVDGSYGELARGLWKQQMRGYLRRLMEGLTLLIFAQNKNLGLWEL
jgi:hypothetical protein